jgi:energy-converting hydrogenase Eha subunit A
VIGGAVVIFYLFLLPTLQSSHDDLFAYSLSVGYPVGDLLLLAGITWALLRRASGNPWSVWLLSAGLIVGLLADVTYGYQRTLCPSPSELIMISRRASHVLEVAGTSWSPLPQWCR